MPVLSQRAINFKRQGINNKRPTSYKDMIIIGSCGPSTPYKSSQENYWIVIRFLDFIGGMV